MNLGIITDPAVGGTFVTWTLYYLSGQTQYWSHRHGSYQPVPDDPLNGLNAHGFQPCQPNTRQDLLDMLQDLAVRDTDPAHVIYFHNFNEHLESPGSTALAVRDLQAHLASTVIISGGIDSGRFNTTLQGRVLGSKMLVRGQRNQSQQEQHQDWVSSFFGQDLCHWQEQGLTEIWDYREFLALNLRPHQWPSVGDLGDRSHPTWFMPCRELWTAFDPEPLLAWLSLPTDTQRLASWHAVYHRWQQQIRPRARFAILFDDIIRAICQGHCMDLCHLDLDVVQEAQIQNALIYDHGLNLKTWQLKRFESTQQLHSLLEQNLHSHAQTDN